MLQSYIEETGWLATVMQNEQGLDGSVNQASCLSLEHIEMYEGRWHLRVQWEYPNDS